MSSSPQLVVDPPNLGYAGGLLPPMRGIRRGGHTGGMDLRHLKKKKKKHFRSPGREALICFLAKKGWLLIRGTMVDGRRNQAGIKRCLVTFAITGYTRMWE